MKYNCELVNDDGCMFDSKEFSNKKEAFDWAMGRGQNYKAKLYKDQELIREWRPRTQ